MPVICPGLLSTWGVCIEHFADNGGFEVATQNDIGKTASLNFMFFGETVRIALFFEQCY